MNSLDIIDRAFLNAAKGIKEEWFISEENNWYDYVVGLSEELKTTYLIVMLHNQVLNGGFHQYFVNGYGQFAEHTISALVKIGAEKKSILLEKALKLINVSNDSSVIFRKRLLEKEIRPLFMTDELFDPLNALDEEYYDENSEDIELLLQNYLKKIFYLLK